MPSRRTAAVRPAPRWPPTPTWDWGPWCARITKSRTWELDPWGGTSGTFDGFDRFGRVVDHLWRDYGGSADADRFKYGYDRAGNRTWKENDVAAKLDTPVHLDELYDYDDVYRLINTERGNLNARHEELDRLLIAVVWAGLCLVLATAAIYGLWRPDAGRLADRGWPWLAAVSGTAWLFVLPAGVFGLTLLVASLWVLTGRSQTST
ncbi:MAG: hypothetical protein R6U98_08575 [Pirellulaceae bacterium]